MVDPYLPQQPTQIPASSQFLQIIGAPNGSSTDDDIRECAVVRTTLEESFEGDGVGYWD